MDTNIIGTFTLLGEMDLLFALFAGDALAVTPAVYAELVAGLREGRSFLQTAVEMVEEETLVLLPLTAQEIVQRLALPLSLNAGEAESIALCKARSAAFVTNDRRARNYCRTAGVEVFDLPEVLRAFWKLRVCSKQRVRQLVADIESKEGLIIKYKGEIFAK